MKFKVLRQHFGDKLYLPGDEREARDDEVKHLVDAGVLTNMDAPLKNKAEVRAPKNKSAD